MAGEKSKNAKLSFGKRIAKWFRDYKSEFKKINWPTWNFTWTQTVIVIVVMVIVGAVVFALDTSLSVGLNALAKLK